MNSKEYISSGIIESYILGLASAEEAGILECVMKNNTEVKTAFEETQKIMEDLATAQAVAPPMELKAKVWDIITAENHTVALTLKHSDSKEEPETVETSAKGIILKISETNKWKNVAIAASVLFLVSIATHLFWFNNQEKKQVELAKLELEKESQRLAMENIQQKWSMISNIDMKAVTLDGVEKHAQSRAVVFWNKKSKEVFLNAENLPEAPKGMQYQLWAIADGKPINAGMYSLDKDSVTALATIPNAQAFAITLEKAGGSESPTMENMYVIGYI